LLTRCCEDPVTRSRRVRVSCGRIGAPTVPGIGIGVEGTEELGRGGEIDMGREEEEEVDEVEREEAEEEREDGTEDGANEDPDDNVPDLSNEESTIRDTFEKIIFISTIRTPLTYQWKRGSWGQGRGGEK